MNKDFEVAKIFAALTGFIGIMISIMTAMSNSSMNIAVQQSTINENISNSFATLWIKSLEGIVTWVIVGVIFLLICLFFSWRGYVTEVKKEGRKVTECFLN